MWWKIWLVWIVVILAVTTMPWNDFVGHSHWDQVRWIPFFDRPLALSDIFANVALFVPFGFFLGRSLPRASRKKVWIFALLMATTLSASVEFLQVYYHNRIPSTSDVCTNLLGALLGVWLSIPRLNVVGIRR